MSRGAASDTRITSFACQLLANSLQNLVLGFAHALLSRLSAADGRWVKLDLSGCYNDSHILDFKLLMDKSRIQRRIACRAFQAAAIYEGNGHGAAESAPLIIFS